MILTPDPDTLIPATGCEVVAKRSPPYIPNRSFVAFVNDEASPGFERPEANGFVGGAGEEESGGSGRNRWVRTIWTRD